MRVIRKTVFSVLAAAAACALVCLLIRWAIPCMAGSAMPVMKEQFEGLTRARVSWSAAAMLLIPALFFAGRLPKHRSLRVLITMFAVLLTLLTVRINAIPLPAAVSAAIRVISSL